MPQTAIVQIVENENRFGELPEFFQGAVERMLSGIRVEAFEKLGGGGVLEFDGRHEA